MSAADASVAISPHRYVLQGKPSPARAMARASLRPGRPRLPCARGSRLNPRGRTRTYACPGATIGAAHSVGIIAQGELDTAERDAYDAIDLAARIGGDLVVPFALDSLAIVTGETGNHLAAARLLGAAEAARQRMGMVRLKVLEADDEARIAAVRDALGENDFDAAWAEGATLSTEEAVAYAQRGRGERKRPSTGWASLTRAELDVARLVTEGLGNKDIALRLFVSPRTVQAHLTHIYTKLGLTSRVQLAQEAARH